MSQPREYRKLPGRGNRREGTFIAGAVRQSRLWLGKDHVLLVDSTLSAQELKRFYFRDIQAITVRKTHTGRTMNLVLTGMAAMFCLWAVLIDDSVGQGILLTIAAVLGGLVVVNSLFGPTCECHLQTSVQRESLPSLGRLRTARKVLGLLRPHIEQAQGNLSADEARERAAALAVAPAAPAPKRAGATPEVRAYRGSFHTILFALLLVDGLLNFSAVFLNSLPLALVQMAVLFGIILTLVGALIRQQDTDLSNSVRRVTWTSLGYLCVLFVHGFAVYIAHAVQKPGEVQNEYTALKHFASLDPFEHTWLLVSFVVWGVCSTALGIVGVVLLSRYNRDRELLATAAAAPPPPPTFRPPLPASPPPMPSAPVTPPPLEIPPPPPSLPPPPAHG